MSKTSAIFTALLLLTGLTTFTTRAFAADGNLYFSPSSTTVDNNCYPKLDVMLDTGGQSTTGVDVIINYDSAKLDVHNLAAGSLYTSYDTMDTSTDGKIVIQTRALAGETFVTTAGQGQKLATITFKTTQTGSASISFKYLGKGNTTDTNIADENGTDILGSSVGNATITIQSGASCPSSGDSDDDDDNTTPTPAPTTYTAPASGSVTHTIALALGGTLFLGLGIAFAWLKK